MTVLMKSTALGLVVALMVLASGCAPAVGSERWCADMKAKPPADWTANQAVDYAKHCILK